MKDLMVHLRYMQLFAHAAHNLCSGPTFFEDHEFFGAAYDAHDADYDAVTERVIGLYGEQYANLAELTIAAAQKLADKKLSSAVPNAEFFKQQLNSEEELCEMVEKLVKAAGITQGVVQLLGDIANASEMRQYKVKQRLA